MRFKLTLKINREKYGDTLPLSYQYEASSAIYRILSNADKEYSTWLHENGFNLDFKKKFKLFTFSRIVGEYKILKDMGRIRYFGETVEWYVSFLPERSTQKFIEGLFLHQTFEIGDKKSVVQFHITCVEAMPEPVYSEEMEFETQSPMCIKLRTEDGYIDYLSPKDVRAPYLIFNGLFDKYKAFYGKSLEYPLEDCKLETLSEPKSALIMIKAGTTAQTKIRGFQCRFKVKAPVEIMKIIYSSGIGVQTSVGFGCVEVINK
ncbi:CRISPR-associated endoribonuclease Cas6 [Prevotella sp.]|uniref:CRISPR-associated endoribonuclease Cas6 n=1 Tax=Prevotella sp. TaxID=59823 RepID=UPI003DA68ED4